MQSTSESDVQAFSWGEYLPALAEGGTAYMVAMALAWAVISAGVGLGVVGLMSEARPSVPRIFEPPSWRSRH
jgi:hypothetical protein